MQATTQRRLPILERTANQILATVAPKTARLVTTRVVLDDDADTAKTDGTTVIILPPDFAGVTVLDDQPLAVGLLAHEVSHFLQPLATIDDVAEAEEIPKWLVNVVIDIQGEYLMECIFPSLRQPLTVCRQAVADAHIPEYEREIAAADSFANCCRLAGSAGSLP